MNPRKLRIRLGLFVALAAVLFASLIIMFGSLPGFFRRTTTYTIRFADAPGIAPGAPVRRSGVRIGEVTAINLDDERGIVRVRVGINRPYLLRKSEQPTIVTGLLGSDSGIDLVPKPADEKYAIDRAPYEPGAEVVGVRAATVGTLLQGASDVVPSAQEALNDIRKSMQRIERLAAPVEKSVPLAEDTMRDYRTLAERAQKSIPEVERTNAQMQELIRSIREVVPDAQRTAEEVRLLSRDIRAAIPEVLKTNREVGLLSRDLREALPTVQGAVEEFQGLNADLRKTVPKLNGAIDDIGALARETQAFVEDVNVFWKKNKGEVEDGIRNFNRTVVDVGDTARSTRSLVDNFNDFWKKNREGIEDSLRRFNRTLTQVNTLLSDDNVKSATRTLRNVEASERFPRISQDTAEITDRGRVAMKTINEVTLPQINSAAQGVNEAVPQLNSLLKGANDTTMPQLNSLLKSANETGLPQFNTFWRSANETTLRQFNALPQSANETTLPQVNCLLRRMEGPVADLQLITRPLAARSDSLVKNVDETLVQMNQTLGDVRALFRAIDRADGTFRRFLTDPSLYSNIDAAACMVARMVPRIDRILKDFETFADKLARHPELIGVGGAVKPSSGLKDPPTPPMTHQPGVIMHPTHTPRR